MRGTEPPTRDTIPYVYLPNNNSVRDLVLSLKLNWNLVFAHNFYETDFIFQHNKGCFRLFINTKNALSLRSFEHNYLSARSRAKWSELYYKMSRDRRAVAGRAQGRHAAQGQGSGRGEQRSAPASIVCETHTCVRPATLRWCLPPDWQEVATLCWCAFQSPSKTPSVLFTVGRRVARP